MVAHLKGSIWVIPKFITQVESLIIHPLYQQSHYNQLEVESNVNKQVSKVVDEFQVILLSIFGFIAVCKNKQQQDVNVLFIAYTYVWFANARCMQHFYSGRAIPTHMFQIVRSTVFRDYLDVPTLFSKCLVHKAPHQSIYSHLLLHHFLLLPFTYYITFDTGQVGNHCNEAKLDQAFFCLFSKNLRIHAESKKSSA